MQPTMYNGSGTNHTKKIIIVSIIIGLLLFVAIIAALLRNEDSQSRSPEENAATEYVKQFNAYLANDPNSAYEEFSDHAKPERELFDGSASFFKSDVVIDKCTVLNTESREFTIEVTLTCPLASQNSQAAISYVINKADDTNLSMLSYEIGAVQKPR